MGFLFASGFLSRAATSVPLVERVFLSYLDEPVVEVPGDFSRRDFLFRLPEHVRYVDGSALHLVLRGRAELWQKLCSVSLYLNDHKLVEAGPGISLILDTNQLPMRFSLPVETRHLEPGWNRVSIRFLLRKPVGSVATPESVPDWELRDADSFFMFAFERMPLFPEPRRFPDSMIEEVLLRGPQTESLGGQGVMTLLLPSERRAIHLKAATVLGACLGKPGYQAPGRVDDLSVWLEQVEERNGVLLGTRSELESLPMPEALRERLESLKEGQGLVSEHIFGCQPHQRRWMVVSGGDDAGLDKALLTLVHKEALEEAPANPAVILQAPQLGPARRPDWDRRRTNELALVGESGAPIEFRGLYESHHSFQNWRVPAGWQTATGCRMELEIHASPELAATGSFLEVKVQEQVMAVIPLMRQTRQVTTLRLPAGLHGVDPVSIRFRARLNLLAADCDPPPSELAWLKLSGHLEARYEPRRETVNDLNEAQSYLISDEHLTRTTLLVPEQSSTDELTWLFQFMQRVGRRLPNAAVLWPQVLGYGPENRPSADQMNEGRVLVLGALKDWEHALPGEARLAFRPGRNPKEARLQGRIYKVDQFEPSLGMVNLLASPWNPLETVMVAGGWETYGLPALTRLFTDPESAGDVFGVAAAMDPLGRSATYDPRTNPNDSLGEQLLENIPAGLNLEETALRRYQLESQDRASARMSFTISVWAGLLLLLLICGRIWLLWERSRIQRTANVPARQQNRG